MSEIKDGGPAFPLPIAEIQGHAATAGQFGPGMTGITVRDYFAAKALEGMLSAYSESHASFPNERVAAERAYDYADAMLKARVQS